MKVNPKQLIVVRSPFMSNIDFWHTV
jgi:hypothetical protein